MFFTLEPITDHPCCKMQEVVETFFLSAITDSAFSSNLFPVWFRSTVEDARSTLKIEFERVHGHLHGNGVEEITRRAIYEECRTTNLISELCDGTAAIARAAIVWTHPVGLSIISLMGRLYESLDLVIFRREDQDGEPTHQFYREFIKVNKYLCPFCGLRRFKNARGARREDFDHYLNKSKYPFAAANTRNLVPTCGVCNQDYKGAANVLAEGVAFYPYGVAAPIDVNVSCQRLPATANMDDKGEWSVTINPRIPNAAVMAKIGTWERVYRISERLVQEIQEYFEEWMDEVRDDEPAREINEEQFRRLIEHAKSKARQRSIRRMEERQIIRAAFFDFMLNRADRTFVESFRILLSRAPA